MNKTHIHIHITAEVMLYGGGTVAFLSAQHCPSRQNAAARSHKIIF